MGTAATRRSDPLVGTAGSSERFVPELQSLRGLAAAMVMAHHALRCIVPTQPTHFVADIMLNAHAAVVIFFVLSGYVLAAALAAAPMDLAAVTTFYVRRVFRIYPAMVFGVALGLAYYLFFRPLSAAHLSTFMLNTYLPERITPVQALLTFLGLQVVLLPPLWTVTVELAASIVMPAIAFIRARSGPALLVLTAVLAVSSFLFPTGNRWILVYLVDFALGACALHYRAQLGRLMAHPLATAIAAAALLWLRQLHPWPYFHPVPSVLEGLASVLVIVGIERNHAAFLRWPPLVRLGDWSFSLYLLHVPVAFSLARVIDHALGDELPPLTLSLLVLTGTVVIVVPLSAWCFSTIEKPGIAVGKRTAEWAAGLVKRRAGRDLAS